MGFSVPVGKSSVKIITWNIYLRPRSLFNDGQLERTQAIAEVLLAEDYDIIGLQEVFDKKSRVKLINLLSEKYPHSVGPGKRGVFRQSSGLMVFSKHPILKSELIKYSDAAVADKLARKGALFVELEVNGQIVQVINTHAQSRVEKRFQRIRNCQYCELDGQLINPHLKPGVPQLILGDMNTDKADSLNYQKMLTTFDVADGQITGDLKTSCNGTENDLYKNGEHKPKLIDFIFLRRNKANIKVKQRQVRQFKKRWSEQNESSSELYAVAALVVVA